jgi:tetratricopeptide (TPR) repeat protein
VAANLPATIVHRASDRTYTISASGGAVRFLRHQREDNVVEKTASVVIGSGNHARSYLARGGDGKFVEMPASWYAARGGYWEMSPGFDRPDQHDFRRVVPDECLFCHAAYPKAGAEADLQPIDCQRCHGPGRAHAESGGRETILNPKKLGRERQLEICMQCHLETTSSPLPNSIRRFERGVYSFRPGEPLGDYMLHFDHPPGTGHDDKFEIAHAAYRLRKSACFQKSGMTCSTCHDPHSVRRGAEAARCRQCHAEAHNANTSCVECHMPKRRAEDAIHVTMTDHFIQRRLAVRPRRKPAPYRGEVRLYYPDQLPASAESEAYLAVAQVQHGANLAEGIPRLEAAVGRLAPSAPEFYFELGKAYSKKGDEAAAARWHEEALLRRADFTLAIKGLTASLMALGRYDRAAELLARIANPDAAMLTNYGHALLKLGKPAEAAGVLERALAANPDAAEAANLIGLVKLGQGDATGAEAQFREAIRLHPELAAAHGNLANMLAGRRDLIAAKRHFEKSLALDRTDAEVRRNYAFLLILMKAYPRARAQLEAAVQLSPSSAPIRTELAEVLQAAGLTDAAVEQYRRALQADPGYLEAHRALGILLLRSGNKAAARGHLEKAASSSDPAISQPARQALASAR